MSADNGLYLQTTRSGQYGVFHYFASDERDDSMGDPIFESPSLSQTLDYGFTHAGDTEYGLSIAPAVRLTIVRNLKTFESL